jgi:hypothetical protein
VGRGFGRRVLVGVQSDFGGFAEGVEEMEEKGEYDEEDGDGERNQDYRECGEALLRWLRRRRRFVLLLLLLLRVAVHESHETVDDV